jgi:hypothetical protein
MSDTVEDLESKYFCLNTSFLCLQLENTIRLLLELEPDSDPVWHYLTIQVSSLSIIPMSKSIFNHKDYGDGYFMLSKLALDF